VRQSEDVRATMMKASAEMFSVMTGLDEAGTKQLIALLSRRITFNAVQPSFHLSQSVISNRAFNQEHSPTRIADPFIMIIHGIGSLPEADMRWPCAETIKFDFRFRCPRLSMTTPL
jgi:hypothetical protein